MKTNLTKYSITLLAGACLAVSAERAAAQTEAPDAAAIRTTAADFHKGLAGGKPDEVMSLLHPDALIIEGGVVQTRAEYESEHLAADIAFASAVPGKQTKGMIRQEGDIAWVTNTFIVSGKYKEKEINELAAETMILAKTPEGWRIRSIHWSSHEALKK